MSPDIPPISRREFLQLGAVLAGATPILTPPLAGASDSTPPVSASLAPILTPGSKFGDVSRGDPKPYTLTGEAQVEARLTPESWRCEITADSFVEEPHTKVPATIQRSLTISDGTALDLASLMEIGRKHEVHFLKAMQCLNIDTPLGQGLWSGVPLREVLKLCGKINNVRRIYFWGFHNHDPNQVFKSSVSYTQCMETPPGELPVILAYRLNGEPLSLQRGGPIRMIVPWSHGYKSIKWLTHIFLTNDGRNNDTYANGNNDPDSVLKTAAYVEKTLEGKRFNFGQAVSVSGQVISGPSGVKRVEVWIRRVEGSPQAIADDAPELMAGPWLPCELEPQPNWDVYLPGNLRTEQLLGFDKTTGKPQSWPPRYGMCSYSVTLRDLAPGSYEVRARSVDFNDFAQPEPRPLKKAGRNGIQVRRFEVV